MTASPKTVFVANPDLVKAHLNLVDSVEFQAAVNATILQILSNLSDTSDPVVAAAGYHRIMGARQFASLILTIADKPKAPEGSLSSGQLNHNA